MIITKDSVVQLHYRVSDASGLIEDSAKGEPMLYLHGHQNMLPAIEQALEGKSAGDVLSLVVEPKDAYGERDDNAIQSIQCVSTTYQRSVVGIVVDRAEECRNCVDTGSE